MWAPFTIWQAVLKGLVIPRQKAYFGPDYYANANAFFSDWKIRFDFKFKLKSCPQLTIRGIRSVGIYERAASGVIYTNRKPAYYLNRFDTMVINAGTLGNISFYFNA